eukprot:CAMPEP_0204909278 /NCGR_PEP_ID=MMETSP1397-20131031/8033_1 /ASSEMBLY_ACC=CAM_ASM_000891 /TAXON_ID=49980 /ORGANISM="Climacostomum Climacostomum virens, Strain Stock W-24" /LENGTH=266 /DNA_ID=CAMNT_0052079057 /DNA_START=685 /DNA_END=1482 /DNA_ORIENTATION=+
MHTNTTGVLQLSYLLKKPIKPSYTTRLTRNLVKSYATSVDIDSFVPFVQERDNVGRLLPSLTERTLPKIKRRNKSCQIGSLTQTRNHAFSTTLSKTTSRRHVEIYPRPPIGHYNISPLCLSTSRRRSSVDLQTTGRTSLATKRVSSVDYVDYDKIYSILERKVSTIDLKKQLAREKEDYDFERERRELYRPPLILPDHLKKYKGLYHVSDIKPEEAKVIDKDSENILNKMKTIKDTLAGLRDFGKQITKNMFKSKPRKGSGRVEIE